MINLRPLHPLDKQGQLYINGNVVLKNNYCSMHYFVHIIQMYVLVKGGQVKLCVPFVFCARRLHTCNFYLRSAAVLAYIDLRSADQGCVIIAV